MKIGYNAKHHTVSSGNATVIMESGEHLSVAFKDKVGEYQVVNLMIRDAVMVVTHEQTDNSLVVRRNGDQYVKG